MNGLNKLKILIVGLTAVLAFQGFNKSDFRRQLTKCDHKDSEIVINDNTLFRN